MSTRKPENIRIADSCHQPHLRRTRLRTSNPTVVIRCRAQAASGKSYHIHPSCPMPPRLRPGNLTVATRCRAPVASGTFLGPRNFSLCQTLLQPHSSHPWSYQISPHATWQGRDWISFATEASAQTFLSLPVEILIIIVRSTLSHTYIIPAGNRLHKMTQVRDFWGLKCSHPYFYYNNFDGMLMDHRAFFAKDLMKKDPEEQERFAFYPLWVDVGRLFRAEPGNPVHIPSNRYHMLLLPCYWCKRFKSMRQFSWWAIVSLKNYYYHARESVSGRKGKTTKQGVKSRQKKGSHRHVVYFRDEQGVLQRVNEYKLIICRKCAWENGRAGFAGAF